MSKQLINKYELQLSQIDAKSPGGKKLKRQIEVQLSNVKKYVSK